MSGSQSTGDTVKIIPDQQSRSMSDTTFKLFGLCVTVAIIMGFIALVLSIVGLAKNGSDVYNIGQPGSDDGTGTRTGQDNDSDRIWMFQIGHFAGNTQYLDEATGTIQGYNVDVVNAVCQRANKDCRLVWDLYERCWLSEAGQRARGGTGLMGSWYDACVGWSRTPDRERTLLFSKPFENFPGPAFFVKSGVNRDLSTSRVLSNLKVGFLDGWAHDEHCLGRYSDVTGFDSSDADRVMHFTTPAEAINALKNDEVDVGFLPNIEVFRQSEDIERQYAPDDDLCLPFGGPAMMTRKDQTELVRWFDDAFEDFKGTSEYQAICNNVADQHGDQPGSPPEDICIV